MIKKIQNWLLLALTFLFPLFFLPVTQDFYLTTKFYLMAFVMLVVMGLSVVDLLRKRSLSIDRNGVQGALLFLILSLIGSVIIASPNKFEALVLPQGGFLPFFFGAIYCLYLISRNLVNKAFNLVFYSGAILSIISILFLFNPLGKASLPLNLQFLQDRLFTPLGFQLDLAVMFGFLLLFGITRIYAKFVGKNINDKKESRVAIKKSIPNIFFTFVVSIGLIISLFHILTASSPAQNGGTRSGLQLPPMNVSWNAAIDTLKNPQTAIFGSGLGNYQSSFTRAKTIEYNQTDFWNISFNRGRSALLDIWTTAGILGLLSILMIFAILIRDGMRESNHVRRLPLVIFIIAIFALLPMSLNSLILLFLVIAQLKPESTEKLINLSNKGDNREVTLIILVILLLVMVGALSLFLGRTYASELKYKNTLDAMAQNKAQESYLNIGIAIKMAPFMERYRIAFSQLNLLVATNILSQVSAQAKETGLKLEDKDRNTVTQAIQQAISQAKSAVNLNSEKATNWENLAIIYSNVIGIAQGSDGWALSAYAQAIGIDPTNPGLALAAGSIYYRTGQYKQAIDLFSRSVRLKPDFANAYYNLAWSLHMSGDSKSAVGAIQQVLGLVDKNSEDYKKAIADLEIFKKSATNKEATTGPTTGNEALTLPKPVPTISPKLELNEKEATPPAGITTGEEEQGKFDLSGTPSPTISDNP